MPPNQLRNSSFGKTRANATGSNGVGYSVVDYAGLTVIPRTVSGVYQVAPDSGCYAAYITFPDNFHGQVLWDTGTAFPTTYYAVEQYNVEENDPKVADTWQMVNRMTGSVQLLADTETGRWLINNNQMVFYKSDNVTEVMRFNLFDSTGNPTMDAVFDRQRVP